MVCIPVRCYNTVQSKHSLELIWENKALALLQEWPSHSAILCFWVLSCFQVPEDGLGSNRNLLPSLRKLLRSTQVQQTSLSFLLPKLSNNLSYCIPKLCRMEAWIFLPLTILALFESGRTWESKLCLSYIACSKTLHKAVILRARATACYTVSCIFYTKKKKNPWC